jgi:hypothetical protein
MPNHSRDILTCNVPKLFLQEQNCCRHDTNLVSLCKNLSQNCFVIKIYQGTSMSKFV